MAKPVAVHYCCYGYDYCPCYSHDRCYYMATIVTITSHVLQAPLSSVRRLWRRRSCIATFQPVPLVRAVAIVTAAMLMPSAKALGR